MNKSMQVAVVVAVLAAVGSGVWWAKQHQARTVPAVQAPVVRVPLESGAAKFAGEHAKLLAEATKLPVPTALAPALANVPPQHGDTPQVAPSAPTLPPVPPEQQVSVAFTSGVIGEIDPCG